MTISAQDRRRRIVATVRETGPIRVVQLAERLGMPAVTVRRDIAALAAEGVLERTHGAVALPDQGPPGSAVSAAGRTIGVLVPAAGQYFGEVVAGVRTVAETAGARLVLGIAPYGADSGRTQARRLVESGAHGLLLVPDWSPDSGLAGDDWLGELPVPTVLVERRGDLGSAAAALDSVCSDHRHGVFLALRRLAGLGHGAVLLAARSDTRTAYEVRAGYAEAVRRLGLTAPPVVDVPNEDGPAAAGGIEAVADAIARAAASGVRAALVHNDRDALALLPLLRDRGLAVPRDLALIAYDDLYASLADPPLTAVAPPKQAVGAEALRLLLRRFEAGDALPVHRLDLLPALIVRRSSDGAA
ncbi:substrate-binding domain-containing protein [Streptomyces sp. NPDC046887]|uniref:substrate-binding domain-containing protein n=1 Tax=Streptomyces sp. NPDC046887 TaxID=3155472 RepID=UPI0033D701B3